MCQHVLIFAERNSQQYISQCEHGTVHLLWDGVGLHLPAEAFNRLAVHVQHTRAMLQDNGESLIHGHCRLSVGKLSVILPVQEFLTLVEMVEEALPALKLTGQGQTNQLRLFAPHQPRPPILN